MTGKVKLISAGGGSVSLATPSTGSNRTVTLPDADVTIGATNSAGVLTTQGDTLYRDGSGIQRLAKGTAGQVLKMNSGATAPEWGTDAGGTCTLVGRTVISSGSAAQLDIEDTALFDGTYDRIVLSFSALRLSADEGFVMGRLKYGGSYQTSSHYNYHTRQWKGNGIDVHSGTTTYEDNGDNFHFMKETGNATGEAATMEVTIWNPGNTSVWKMMEWTGTLAQKDSKAYIMRGGGYYHNTSTGQGAMQGFRLYTTTYSGGTANIADCIVNKYGWKTS